MDHQFCFILLLVNFGTVTRLVFGACPYNDTNCVCSGTTVTCTNLETVPPLVSNDTDIDTLIFSYGNVNQIFGNNLPPNLVSITFEILPLTAIAPDAFDNSAATLRNISFLSAQMSELPIALLAVDNLTSLTVANTPTYNNYNRTLMKHLGKSVRTLSLISDRLSGWPTWFNDFTCLKDVNLYGISLNFDPQMSFTPSASTISYLNVSRALTETLSNTFSYLSSLTTLVLSNNMIGRNTTDIEISLLPIAKSLKILYLDSNSITDLPAAIASMNNLVLLDLTLNTIAAIPSNSFPVNLRELRLPSNSISQIANDSFPNGSNLEILDLSYNSLSAISPLAFQSLTKLKILLLYSTSLTKIPISVTALIQLENVDLNFNFRMKCYCPRSELVKWYRSRSQITISGFCTGYDGYSSYSLLTYFTNGGYKLVCSGFAPVVASWHLLMVMFFVACFQNLVRTSSF